MALKNLVKENIKKNKCYMKELEEQINVRNSQRRVPRVAWKKIINARKRWNKDIGKKLLFIYSSEFDLLKHWQKIIYLFIYLLEIDLLKFNYFMNLILYSKIQFYYDYLRNLFIYSWEIDLLK